MQQHTTKTIIYATLIIVMYGIWLWDYIKNKKDKL